MVDIKESWQTRKDMGTLHIAGGIGKQHNYFKKQFDKFSKYET
jgi:hypothetical protein